MEWIRSLMLPPQGSAFAAEVDTLYMFLFWLSVVLFLGIAFAAHLFRLALSLQAGPRDAAQTHNTVLEIVWTVMPLLLCVGIFFWGLNG